MLYDPVFSLNSKGSVCCPGIQIVPCRAIFCSVWLHIYCSLLNIISSLIHVCRCISFVPWVIYSVPLDFGVGAYVLFPLFKFSVYPFCSLCFI